MPRRPSSRTDEPAYSVAPGRETMFAAAPRRGTVFSVALERAGDETPAPSAARQLGRSILRRWVFPGVWLVYLGQTAAGVSKHSSGLGEIVGFLILPLFAACYLMAIPLGGPHNRPLFRLLYASMLALTVIEAVFAHSDASLMLIYVAVLSVSTMGWYGLPVIAVLAVAAVVTPTLIPSWHQGLDWEIGLTLLLVALAMSGFFGVMRSNRALASARSEVARLAAENERSRIARDLHDLLGHSLTTITVKAGLARRLSEVDPSRAAAEIAEVEELTRRTLTQVREAVTGYRDVSVAGELATARAVLRASGIDAVLPRAVDDLDPAYDELFGWVLREAVTNVVRHSRAEQCAVNITRTELEVSDDGRGGPAAAGSHGLTGIRERVAAVGGSVSAGPRAGGGWSVRVQVPAS